jgi:hypothetical protein
VTRQATAANPLSVHALRRLFHAYRTAATLICLAALALKLVVPAGYMISAEAGQVAVTLCSNGAPKLMGMNMPATHHTAPDHGKSQDHGKAEMPCAFSSLSVQALGGIDPVLVLAAIAFVMAVALRPARVPAPPGALYLRPPLRGPPTLS